MSSANNPEAQRVKQVTELIHSQHWSFNDFLIAFYSSKDRSIATQRGQCLMHRDGERYAVGQLLDLWWENCPSASKSDFKHVIINHAARIITKEANKACAMDSLYIPTTSVTASDLDEGFLLSKLQPLYETTLPFLWLLLHSVIASPNRSEQRKQQTSVQKGTRTTFVESVTCCNSTP